MRISAEELVARIDDVPTVIDHWPFADVPWARRRSAAINTDPLFHQDYTPGKLPRPVTVTGRIGAQHEDSVQLRLSKVSQHDQMNLEVGESEALAWRQLIGVVMRLEVDIFRHNPDDEAQWVAEPHDILAIEQPFVPGFTYNLAPDFSGDPGYIQGIARQGGGNLGSHRAPAAVDLYVPDFDTSLEARYTFYTSLRSSQAGLSYTSFKQGDRLRMRASPDPGESGAQAFRAEYLAYVVERAPQDYE